jgi:hypothetical protein
MREALIVLLFVIASLAVVLGLLWFGSRSLDRLDAEDNPWR